MTRTTRIPLSRTVSINFVVNAGGDGNHHLELIDRGFDFLKSFGHILRFDGKNNDIGFADSLLIVGRRFYLQR